VIQIFVDEREFNLQLDEVISWGMDKSLIPV